jgi:hypothetical protein
MLSTTRIPNILYHYCGVEAFQGIISSKKLWLCNIYQTNDYKEFTWLIDYANRYISRQKKFHAEPFYRYLPKPLTLNREPYVTCFSERGDLLSQWRAYSEDGAGFAIGFDEMYLEKRLEQYRNESGQCCSILLRKVEYSERKQHKCVMGILDRSFRDAKECNEHGEYENRSKENAERATILLWMDAAECKNPAFKEEKEWRIVWLAELDEHRNITERSMPSKIAFRTSKTRIIPHYEFDFGLSYESIPPIKRIMLGPKNYARDRRDELKLLLIHSGYQAEEIEIVNSKASYW